MTDSPYMVCERLLAASKTVPFIRSVPIKVVGANGEKDISLSEVKVAFSAQKTIPNLYSRRSTAYDRIAQLEAHVAATQDTLKSLWAAVEELQSRPKAVAEPLTVVGQKRLREMTLECLGRGHRRASAQHRLHHSSPGILELRHRTVGTKIRESRTPAAQKSRNAHMAVRN